MAINLSKGENKPLDPGFTSILVGLGWDPRTTAGEAFDLDASAFMLGADKKVRADSDLIFYNHKESSCGSVIYAGDNRTGDGDGDDEQIHVDLTKVPSDVDHIVFTVTIYKGVERKQNFGQVDNAFIRLVDKTTGEEVFRFDLTEDACIEQSLIFAELYRRNGAWKFKALGEGLAGDLGALAAYYGVNV